MREMPVASEKIAVERASRRAGRAATGVAAGSVSPAPVVVASSATPTNVTRAGGDLPPLVPFARPPERAFSRDAEHQAAEEARPDRRRGAAREPPLPVDDQDPGEAARHRGRGRRQRR